MKKFIIQTTLLLIVTFLALFLYKGNFQPSSLPFLPSPTVEGVVKIKDTRIRVLVADTPAKRSRGLSIKESLASDEGMLFIFEKEDRFPFWMKGIRYPLDFIWIRRLTVVDLTQNVPPPASGQSDESLPIYQSSTEVDKLLEVPAGTVGRLNVKVGDTISIE